MALGLIYEVSELTNDLRPLSLSLSQVPSQWSSSRRYENTTAMSHLPGRRRPSHVSKGRYFQAIAWQKETVLLMDAGFVSSSMPLSAVPNRKRDPELKGYDDPEDSESEGSSE